MTESPWTAFQLHRHDVQNYMQLVKAYFQLGKPEKAMDAANQCADWLTSLSRLQSQLHEDVDGSSALLWTAATCSHVRVSLLTFSSALDVSSLCAGIEWLEQQAAVHNSKYINAKLSVLPSGTQAEQEPDVPGEYGNDEETVQCEHWHVLVDGPDLETWWSPDLASLIPQDVIITVEPKKANAPSRAEE